MRVFFLFVVRWFPDGEERMQVMVVAVVVGWWVGYSLKLGVDLFDLADVAGEVCSCDVCDASMCARIWGLKKLGAVKLVERSTWKIENCRRKVLKKEKRTICAVGIGTREGSIFALFPLDEDRAALE